MGIKPDLIAIYPRHADYPIFRDQIARYRNHFDKVIVMFQYFNTTTKDFMMFVAAELNKHDVMCYETGLNSHQRPDWRDHSTNIALSMSESSHVLFIEQDFLIYNDALLPEVFAAGNDVCLVENHERLHPAFMLISRENINRTSLDFAVGEGYDHFGRFTKELSTLGHSFINLEDMGFIRKKDFDHLAGLTYNHDQILAGNEHLYRPEDFCIYLQQCLDSSITLDEEWVCWAKAAITRIETGV